MDTHAVRCGDRAVNGTAAPVACAGFAGLAAARGAALVAASRLADAKTDAAWVLHHDPAGFTLRKPVDWQVLASAGEIAVADPRGTAAALVRARVVPARANLARWLQQHYAATEPGLYNVRMQNVEGRGAQVARAAFDYGSNVFQGRASVIAVRHGDMATLFVAAAARADFAQRLPELALILDSLRFGGNNPRGPTALGCGTDFKPLRDIDLSHRRRRGAIAFIDPCSTKGTP